VNNGFQLENFEHYTDDRIFLSRKKKFNNNKLECCKYNIQCIPVVVLNTLMSNHLYFTSIQRPFSVYTWIWF